MPRNHVESGQGELRLKPEDEAVLPRAQAVITESEKLRLSERDSLRVLDLQADPPDPPARLIRAAKAGFGLE